jgi:hypothetical protein
MRILLNPVFSMETSELLGHDGESFVDEIPIRFDRSVQSRAKSGSEAATGVGGGFGAEASQIGSEVIPGLERQAATPTGFAPTQKAGMLTSGAEAVGGANAGITGEANLAAARTRNAGGFAHALDEAARVKGRQLATNALGVNAMDARLGIQRQDEARRELAGIRGQDQTNQLRAMGIADEDLRTALEAGKSGWQQNAMNWIDTLSKGAATGKAIAG